MPFVKPYGGQHGRGSGYLVRERRSVTLHHGALIIAAAIVARVTCRAIIADDLTDETIGGANFGDGRGPYVADVFDMHLVCGHRLQLAQRMIDCRFDACVNAAVARVTVIVHRRM